MANEASPEKLTPSYPSPAAAVDLSYPLKRKRQREKSAAEARPQFSFSVSHRPASSSAFFSASIFLAQAFQCAFAASCASSLLLLAALASARFASHASNSATVSSRVMCRVPASLARRQLYPASTLFDNSQPNGRII